MSKLTFDQVAEKYSKANKDATEMKKTRAKKQAELRAKLSELEMQLIDEQEELELALIKPNKDLIEAYEQVTITESKISFIKKTIGDLFPDMEVSEDTAG